MAVSHWFASFFSLIRTITRTALLSIAPDPHFSLRLTMARTLLPFKKTTDKSSSSCCSSKTESNRRKQGIDLDVVRKSLVTSAACYHTLTMFDVMIVSGFSTCLFNARIGPASIELNKSLVKPGRGNLIASNYDFAAWVRMKEILSYRYRAQCSLIAFALFWDKIALKGKCPRLIFPQLFSHFLWTFVWEPLHIAPISAS